MSIGEFGGEHQGLVATAVADRRPDGQRQRYGDLMSSPVTRRRVATLERDMPRVVELAGDAGVGIEYLGIGPLFAEPRTFVGEETDWVLGPAQPSDTVVPKAQAAALGRLSQSGLDFPVLYVAHELPKGRVPESATAAVGSVIPVATSEVAEMVGSAPPPASVVELGDRLALRARQVFAAMGKAVPIIGAVAAAPFLLVGAAVAGLATLDPIIFGAVPAVSARSGEPAAWYVLARWDW